MNNVRFDKVGFPFSLCAILDFGLGWSRIFGINHVLLFPALGGETRQWIFQTIYRTEAFVCTKSCLTSMPKLRVGLEVSCFYWAFIYSYSPGA